MNTVVALPNVAALPVAAPAMPARITYSSKQPTLPAEWLRIDADLVHAAQDLEAVDQEIDALHRKFENADERDDYELLSEYRIGVGGKELNGTTISQGCNGREFLIRA